MKKLNVRLSHTQIIALGFFLLVLVGAILLCLPWASKDGQVTRFSDALFTSGSASCVTGLVVVDTATHWSLFGQIVIMCLIQTGGLGFMTIVTFFFMLMRRRVGLRERQMMTESVNAGEIGGILSLTRTIFFGTVVCETVGAALLAIRFVPLFGRARGIWYAVFHSVSAFCNAGFDLMGEGDPYCSLTAFSADPLVSLTVMGLITVGGLGFLVWDDLLRRGFRWKRYKLQTKVVLAMTALLSLGGAALILFFERANPDAGANFGERVLTALFGSVTARTAGFNTTDTAALTEPSTLLTLFLMFVGGNAGGVKTTSVCVIAAFALCGMRREQCANLFGRRLSDETLKQAVYIVSANLALAVVGAVVIVARQTDLPIRDVLFEVFSAIGTVGMTTGVTRQLAPLSRVVVMLLMYLGRVGSVSFGLAMMERKARPSVTYPTEHITVG